MLTDMDATSGIPPEVLSDISNSSQESNSSQSAFSSKAPTHPVTSSIQQGLSGKNDQLSQKQQLELLSPRGLMGAISSQLLGETSQAQKEAEQKRAQKLEQSIAQARQDWQAHQAKARAQEEGRVQTTVELKAEALKLGSFEPASAVNTQTTGGDLSEQTLIRVAMVDVQEREKHARQVMSSPSTPKGPQAEGGQKKTSTFANMMHKNENAHKQQDDPGARQRAKEQAMGE